LNNTFTVSPIPYWNTTGNQNPNINSNYISTLVAAEITNSTNYTVRSFTPVFLPMKE